MIQIMFEAYVGSSCTLMQIKKRKKERDNISDKDANDESEVSVGYGEYKPYQIILWLATVLWTKASDIDDVII